MEAERTIISSKDILSTEFYEIDMAAVNQVPRMRTDDRYRIAYINIVSQLRSLMNYDIKKLDKTRQETEFVEPTETTLKSLDEWKELHTNLRTLAREIGIVGRESAPHGDSLIRYSE